MQVVLTIAGSDSGGGAGIQADLKTFQELEVFGTSVITAITAQNTQVVSTIQAIDVKVIVEQLNAVLQDFEVSCIKTGMLYSEAIITAIATVLQATGKPIVVDPVMVSKAGSALLGTEAVVCFKQYILPLAYVITPNIPETEVLTGISIQSERDIEQAAKVLRELGARNVVIKGGHLDQQSISQDYLWIADKRYRLSTPRVATENTHGTGCTFSAAICAFLAQGYELLGAVTEAKRFIQMAIENNISLGHGKGPVNHFSYQSTSPRCDIDIETY